MNANETKNTQDKAAVSDSEMRALYGPYWLEFGMTSENYGETLKRVLQAVNGCDRNATGSVVEACREHAALMAVAEAAGHYITIGEVNKHEEHCTCRACKLWESLTALAVVRKGAQ